MIATLHNSFRALLPCLCVCALVPTLAMGQTLDDADPTISIPLRDGAGPLRDIPVLETEDGFVPQFARPEPTRINAPDLVIVVKEPMEISTPDLKLVVKEPIQIVAPDLVIVVKEPAQIAAPDLVIVVREPEDIIAPAFVFVVEEDEDEADKDSDENDAPPDLGNKTVIGPRICVGDYTVHSAGSIGKGIGPDGKPVPTMPVGTPVMAKARLSTDSCGEFLTMNSQGQSILLARQDGDENVYVGEMKMPDGVTRILQLTCGRDLNMHGVLFARDANLKLRRPLWLRPVKTTTLASCVK